jgi:tetratricopeptide (TPR) repeat protein
MVNITAPGQDQRLAPGCQHTNNGTMPFPGAREVAAAAVFFLAMCAQLMAADCGNTRYDCAVYYISRHQSSAAIQLLNDELQQSPGNLKALNLLGIALTESGQVEQANQRFKAALAIDASFFPARKNLAINEFDSHHLQQAAANFAKVLEQSPSDEVAQVYLGEISFQKRDFAGAQKHYEKAGKRVAARAPWILHYAECLARSGGVSRAAALLDDLPPNGGDARFQGGLLLGNAGDYPDAAALFASARKNYSDPYVAGYNQLLMLIRAENFSGAISVFNQLQTEPGYNRAELYNLISEAYQKSGDLKQAYESLRTATKLDPAGEQNYVDLAALCLDDADYDLGLQVLDIGIHYVPNSYRMYVQRGFMLVMRGRTVDAEKEFQTASRIAPDKSLPYIALGEVWMQIGQAQKAADMLREKSKIPGADFLMSYVLAESLIRSGADTGTSMETEAVQALQNSIRQNSKFARSHAELGKLLMKEGEIDRAIPELKIATELDPNDSGPFYQLGQAYRKKGQKAQADEMLARVAQLHSPERGADVNQELKRLVKEDTAPSATEAKP